MNRNALIAAGYRLNEDDEVYVAGVDDDDPETADNLLAAASKIAGVPLDWTGFGDDGGAWAAAESEGDL